MVSYKKRLVVYSFGVAAWYAIEPKPFPLRTGSIQHGIQQIEQVLEAKNVEMEGRYTVPCRTKSKYWLLDYI